MADGMFCIERNYPEPALYVYIFQIINHWFRGDFIYVRRYPHTAYLAYIPPLALTIVNC
jgi:hypothetical protein